MRYYLDMLSECRGVCSERKSGRETSLIEKGTTVSVIDWCYSVIISKL
jgi:hypothetical protein